MGAKRAETAIDARLKSDRSARVDRPIGAWRRMPACRSDRVGCGAMRLVDRSSFNLAYGHPDEARANMKKNLGCEFV
jgi:hypothetical protein